MIDEGYTHSEKTPFYGKDRTCAICDTCPEGYIELSGCSDENDTSNVICQRNINLDELMSRSIKCPAGKFYSKEAVNKFLEEVYIDKNGVKQVGINKKMREEDNKIREELKAHNFLQKILILKI